MSECTKARETEVNAELDILESVIESLVNAECNIIEKIKPILSCPSDVCDVEKAPDSDICPLADQLRRLRRKIDYVTESLNNAKNRVEV